MNTYNNIYDVMEEAESRVAFVQYALGCIWEQGDSGPGSVMPKAAWAGLVYITQDIMDVLKEARKMYEAQG